MREWWSRKTPEERRAHVARRDPAKVRVQNRKKMRKRYASNPEHVAKMRARRAVRDALRKGLIERGPCEHEGPECEGRIEGHHDDYAKPLSVRWLCRRHHHEAHEPVRD